MAVAQIIWHTSWHAFIGVENVDGETILEENNKGMAAGKIERSFGGKLHKPFVIAFIAHKTGPLASEKAMPNFNDGDEPVRISYVSSTVFTK